MLIGIDTNILVRIFLEDNQEQVSSAQNFLISMSSKNRLFISSYTILELAWVLRVNSKKKHQIIDVIETILDIQGVAISQRSIVLVALEKYRTGKADFGDYMIAAAGEEEHVHLLATFDKELIKDRPSHYMNPDSFSKKF